MIGFDRKSSIVLVVFVVVEKIQICRNVLEWNHRIFHHHLIRIRETNGIETHLLNRRSNFISMAKI